MPKTQIHGSQIMNETVSSNIIVDQSIDGADIAHGSITNEHIVAGIDASKISIADSKYVSTDLAAALTESATKVETLETNVNNTISTEIANINTRITDVEEDINSNINTQITTLGSRITQVETDINSNINTQISTINDNISTLQSDVNTTINNEITSLSDNKAEKNGSLVENFATNTISVAGNIIPTTNGVQTIGSDTYRFKAIYVDEAYLSTNTLYLGDTPVLGTNLDTITIKADLDQSINVKTTGTGQTLLTSQNGVEISTSGLNADVKVQATGTGGRAVLAATQEVNMTATDIKMIGNVDITGNTVVDNLTVGGSFTVLGNPVVVNATTVEVSDNILVLNKGEVGHGVTAGQAGLRVDRGEENDYLIVFDETEDMFKVGMVGDLETIASHNWVMDNMYVHPATHAASMITEDTTHRFFTDVERTKLANTKQAIIGSGNFASHTSYTQIDFGSAMANTNYTVSVTPTAATGGNLGEVWVEKSLGYFQVFNTGTFTGTFDYQVMY